MNTSIQKVLGVFGLLCAFASTSFAATVTREENVGEDRLMVLENETARVVVFPAAGAAITQFVDKRSGLNLVAGTVTKGRAGYGWKDTTRVSQLAPASDVFGAQPYAATFKKGDGYAAIVASLTYQGLRVEREMRLDDDSPQLTVLIRYTNVSDKPLGLWARWHPYMTVGDLYARHSFIATPGPGRTEMRKIAVGTGFDSNFMDVPGYWLAADAQTGNGIWMTFRKQDAVDCYTWTDYNFTDHPRRGWFVAEALPKPTRLAPHAQLDMQLSYTPFRAQDDSTRLPMTFVQPQERAAALRFARLVRGNLAVVQPYTMLTKSSSVPEIERENRFFFNAYTRRDRFALLDWGIADALMAVPGEQSHSIRLSLHAQPFSGQSTPVKVTYRLTVTDSLGRQAAQKKWDFTVTPDHPLLYHRENYPLKNLPDGRYTFTLDVLAGGGTNPVHRVVEQRKLAGTRRALLAAKRLKQGASTFLQNERPFVRALREVALPARAGNMIRVPIGVEEADGIARHRWPLRVGVPFTQGALPKQVAARLISPNGKTVPAQTHIMGTWPGGSVKWLLVDFAGDVPANRHVFYTLEAGPGTPQNALQPIARQRNGSIVIDTGALRSTLSTAAGGKLLGIFAPDDIWWETGSGRRYQFRLKGEGAGIVIAENGPQRAVVKATGWYYDARDARAAPIARGELRAEYYRGQKFFHLYHTVTYAGDSWSDTLGSYGLRFPYSGKAARTGHIALDGKVQSADGVLSVQQVDENTATVRKANKQIALGHKAPGVASLAGADASFVVYHKDLWKLYPKRIEANPAAKTLTFDYWPKSAGALDWRPREDGWMSSSQTINNLAAGVSRTHEFIVEDNARRALIDYPRLFDEPVLAVVPPRYLTATGAMLHLQPYNPEKAPELEKRISEAFDSYILNQDLYGWYGEWAYGAMPNAFVASEGRWFNDGRAGHILNEEDICQTPWLAFLRSGDRKYYNFAVANTRQLLEVSTIRLDPVWPETAGMSRRHHECLWLGGGDYGHSMVDPFVELYHVTGYQPAWEAAERMAHAMALQREGTWRYISNPIAGLSRMYLETGEPFYKQQADRIWNDLCAPDRNTWWLADHGNRMVMYYSQLNPECARLWKEWTLTKPDVFTGLDVLSALYGQTGDEKYAREAGKVFQEYQKELQQNDPARKDPLRWSIAQNTQFTLTQLREMCYASAALSAPNGKSEVRMMNDE